MAVGLSEAKGKPREYDVVSRKIEQGTKNSGRTPTKVLLPLRHISPEIL